uniref:Uncharacterized protein n=1 Tax=Anguilla anguilla TaxID=7936 RepID=A0A0E9U5J6_ANGAN
METGRHREWKRVSSAHTELQRW